MDLHKPKPWHGVREFLKEYVIIVVGVLTALAAEQGVEWLHWRYEVAEARNAVGREITYNIKALTRMDQQNDCLRERMDALAAWASGLGPRPAAVVRMPLNYVLKYNAWQVANAGQVTSHFPLELKLSYTELFTRFDNLRDTIIDERDAWAQIVALANLPNPDADEMRQLRKAVGLAKVWQARRRNNFALVKRMPNLGVDGPGPGLPPPQPLGNEYFSLPCAPIGADTF